jgi:hypothetical protein
MKMAMRSTSGMISAAFLLLSALTGCAEVVGIEDFSVGQATGGGGSGSGGGAPVDACNAVHGCARATAKDETGLTGVYISFSETTYTPRCIVIDSGTTVTFKSITGTFVQVPLAGGVFPEVDPESPIKTPSDQTSTETSFTLSGACSFPYFSSSNGQTGVIFVE